jgi:hypothetical protein
LHTGAIDYGFIAKQPSACAFKYQSATSAGCGHRNQIVLWMGSHAGNVVCRQLLAVIDHVGTHLNQKLAASAGRRSVITVIKAAIKQQVNRNIKRPYNEVRNSINALRSFTIIWR